MPAFRDVAVGELFDDRHLIFCETALHAAVSSGHKDVVNELLSRDTRALACHDYTGRTPLHEAVRKNHKAIMKMLLNEPQTKINFPCSYWQNVQDHIHVYHFNVYQNIISFCDNKQDGGHMSLFYF